MAAETYPSNSDFVIHGHWSRPGGQHRVAGDLHYKEGKIELDLLGAFDDAEGPNPFTRSMPELEPRIIHGESAAGTPITLVNSFYTRWQASRDITATSPVPVKSSSLTVNAMLFGVHLDSENEPSFIKTRLTIPNLSSWIGHVPFKFSIKGYTQMKVAYETPAKQTFEIPGWGKLHFVSAMTPPSAPIDEELTIKHQTYVEIEPESPQDFEWYVETAGQVERLFTLLFGTAVRATRNQLVYLKEDKPLTGCVYLPVDRITQPQLSSFEFTVHYPTIAEWFPKMLISWFCESTAIRHALDLVFSSIHRPGHFVETRFMPFIQAVEVYSRAVDKSQIVEKARYKSIRKEIVKSIPSDLPADLVDGIGRALDYANERTLRTRVIALIDELNSETRELFCLDAADFAKGVVDTRNFLTHYSTEGKALDGVTLHWATVKLHTMMKVLLLKRLGIPEQSLRDAIRKTQWWFREKRQWEKISELPMPKSES